MLKNVSVCNWNGWNCAFLIVARSRGQCVYLQSGRLTGRVCSEMEYDCKVRIVPARTVAGHVSASVGEACRSCPRYGRRWGCPPLRAEDTEAAAGSGIVVLIGLEVPSTTDLRRLRAAVESVLLYYERRTGGRMAALAGDCPYCPAGEECARAGGNVCRRPECVRPSLEALGVDVAGLVRDVFGRDLVWGGDTVFIVGALFLPDEP